MNAPFSWPKSSLSISAAGSAAQLTLMNGFPAAGCAGVDGARDELLAGAGLAEDQHGRVGRRHLSHAVAAPPRSAGAAADDLLEVVLDS